MADADPITRLNAALEGRYRIERELGEGGMATVYLAEDLKHERKVALKVLKPELAAVVGADRFLAEIKTTANLQHPHILGLYDSGEANGLLFYVMPYVAGESLRERLDREHQLPVDEAVQIANNVAEALDYAHRQGVIHRDIKPANVLLQDGKPVIADFGIAFAVSAGGGDRLTETGLSLGTPHYMSPEQATGDLNVGPQTDIWALGCVLYEMLVGEPPFTGSTSQAVLGKIITAEVPSAKAERVSVPSNVEAVIVRALEKVPADRFKSVAALGVALGDPAYHLPPAPATAPQRGYSRLAAGTLSILSLGLLGALGWTLTRPSPVRDVHVLASPFLPGEEPSGWGTNHYQSSADGSSLAYLGSGASWSIWIRRWAQPSGSPFPGTEGAFMPRLSPDATHVVFRGSETGNDRIRVASLEGGPVRTIAEGTFPWWERDGFIYFTRRREGIFRIPPTGGRPELILEQIDDADQYYFGELPDEKWRFLIAEGSETESSVSCCEVRVFDPGSGEVRTIVQGDYPTYSPTGHLVYYLQGPNLLMAVPFDPGRAQVTGPAVPVLSEVDGYTLGANGTLFYTRAAQNEVELVWVDREGTATPVDTSWSFNPGGIGSNRSAALSPDGSRIAVRAVVQQESDIWIKEVADGPFSRLTVHEGVDQFARWSPDGERIAFISDRDGGQDVWVRRADQTGEPERLLDMERNIEEVAWSPDGEWLIVREGSGRTSGTRDIWGLRLGSDAEPVPIAVTEFDEAGAAISPDGRWIAYQSDESGRRQVYVQPFPGPEGRRVQMSVAGGRAPVWANSRPELYYLDEDESGLASHIMVANFNTGDEFEVLGRRILFELDPDLFFNLNSTSYSIAADDQQFLMVRNRLKEMHILITNFDREIERLVPN